MTIINGWKIKFGDFIGSTYAFNRLKELFDQEFNQELSIGERDGRLYILIKNEELETEAVVRNMFYYIKGYCIANKTITFITYETFK